ncbi:response regulator [Paenibacillus sp. LMG 31456]|uniref:Response regulator n=1 Tax=Paenibacillus foliorum TaxID=2654974 RepID=A0A972JYN5_9BACL|nr:response regulator [Paenibacillus foliorum]NOU92736.1 response regulator [Paenibacillus foliorum]
MKSIYIIDDEPMICVGLSQMVKEYNQFGSIQTFTDSIKALESIISNPPEIVLTDISMPRMDGLELCRNIYERKLPSKMIILSGYNQFNYAQKCISYGVREYLLKPVTELELYPALDKVLSEGRTSTFSLSWFEHWLESMEESIWTADNNRLDALLQQILTELFKDESDLGFQQQIVKDGLMMLSKKLNMRGAYQFQLELIREEPHKNGAAPFYMLDKQIKEWSQQLSAYRGGNQINVLEASLAYIEEHLSEDLTLEAVAEQMGLTPTYFSHYFKKMTNETFVQYRLRKRVELAKKLLAVPHSKIIDIMTEVGYDSYPHFSRTFKKITGYSPTEYRTFLGIK